MHISSTFLLHPLKSRKRPDRSARTALPFGKSATFLQPKHIQEFYQYELEVRGVNANTVIHFHANIRKALQYAFKTDVIPSNPADKVEHPKKINLSAQRRNEQTV